MATLSVITPGLLTTIQDSWRSGFRRIGMPTAGVMDYDAARLSNLLLGNDENAPVLEMTLTGAKLACHDQLQFVITGGDMQPRLNGQPLELWTVYQAERGDQIDFAGLRSGCRTYLAVTGGFVAPVVMGSASTYLRGQLGGYSGRALQAGDVLQTGEPAPNKAHVGLKLPEAYHPNYRVALRVILGPQDDAFTPQGIETFLSSVYTVTHETDRMGCRLEGAKITHRLGADIISDGLMPGSIQVPAHGAPIIMLADAQTTGGYAKIAAVISVDLPSVAQMKPGDNLTFQPISVEDAQHLYRVREARMNALRAWVTSEIRMKNQPITMYRVTINGQSYHVSIQAR
ncbi:urea amidolyase related protein [Candidatus Moduliflexus flocculans]|uniref:Urea amidolyase related protein n=1 Tax=Candidatus Moduliflexus flocculans TaxID=1499966 RepID=A0A081BQB1_9BACT|nr:urea amidolyase related protein [Candidatus Moduliflexus flocculans]